MTVRPSSSDADRFSGFGHWRDAICEHIVELRAHTVGTPDSTSFTGGIVRNSMDGLQVSSVIADAHEVVRTPRLISRSDNNDLFLTVLVAGDGMFEQAGRCAVLARPGDFVLLDSSRPYRGRLNGRSRQVVVRVPRSRLAVWLPRFEQVTAVTVSGASGVGAMASGLLRSLPLYGEETGPMPSLAGPVYDLVAAALYARGRGGVERESVRASHLGRARSFIRQNLDDPTLTPALVAKGSNVSLRYLYALFESDGTSPARWILEERLARADALLVDPRWEGRTIEEIALRVGFSQAAHFTRTFKTRYGITPSRRRRA
ncbi:AraC-like ligand-binding domain-containing protein [Modestobacter lapidis]|nr:helix-turn-helix domain-containing protein [Modestobacter lapidis]